MKLQQIRDTAFMICFSLLYYHQSDAYANLLGHSFRLDRKNTTHSTSTPVIPA
jgi:hypothetical protein